MHLHRTVACSRQVKCTGEEHFRKGQVRKKGLGQKFSVWRCRFSACYAQIKEDKTMQYLLLIYENEKRFSKGFPEAELAEYRAFGNQFAGSIKGGNALQPTGSPSHCPRPRWEDHIDRRAICRDER